MALHVANSLFLGDYLTSEGQGAREDLQMIRDGGFEVLGAETHGGAGDFEGVPAGGVAVAVAPRHRGVGTSAAPNA